ncbi:unnamed protein product [Staurois parvus]|uniref:Uncharacterized protein n=1 Tax=Staurois parvus TaxID=386267 RepID=A0ABN9DDE8_9NEOB|nr:unnamed protein product [Staurois parvus]
MYFFLCYFYFQILIVHHLISIIPPFFIYVCHLSIFLTSSSPLVPWGIILYNLL